MWLGTSLGERSQGRPYLQSDMTTAKFHPRVCMACVHLCAGPALQSDTTTANFWIAVSDVPEESGCMRYVPGSHKEPALREHKPGACVYVRTWCQRRGNEACTALHHCMFAPCLIGDMVRRGPALRKHRSLQ